MATRKDFLLENNVLVIRNNDLVISDSDQQHIQDIISSFPGWFKESPTIGASAMLYVNAPNDAIKTLEGVIKAQLLADGYDKKKISITEFTDTSKEISIYDQP